MKIKLIKRIGHSADQIGYYDDMKRFEREVSEASALNYKVAFSDSHYLYMEKEDDGTEE